MKVSITRNFSDWASNDENLKQLEICRIFSKASLQTQDIRALRSLGMPPSTTALLYAMMKESCYTGFALFDKMRFLCWTWANKDKIIFPLNSNNQLYIGNDSIEWCDFWPFFKINSHEYFCTLYEFKDEVLHADSDSYVLGLGGQSHFGHFIGNRVAALRQCVVNHAFISSIRTVLVPKDYLPLHTFILDSMLEGSKKYEELPSEAGIYTYRQVAIPCIDEHQEAFINFKGFLEQRYNNREIKNSKRVYITRAVGGYNDRIAEFDSFSRALRALNFLIINPVELTAYERLEQIGDASFILADPGSCGSNAFLFGNKNSSIKCIIPSRVLMSNEFTVINQICQDFIGRATRGYWLPLHSAKKSDLNPWYDINQPPSFDDLSGLIEGCQGLSRST